MTDFMSDLKRITAGKLTAAGASVPTNASLRDLLHGYYTIEERRIAPKARAVHRSKVFDATVATLDAEQRNAISAIEQKLRSGADVNGHLNLRSLQPDKPDGLLVDWAIHHLHLSFRPHPTDIRFLRRTRPVACVHIAAHDAYFLNIVPHGAWTDRSLVEILIREFPRAAEKFELRGISPDLGITEDSIRACRKLGVVYVIGFNGRTYRPPSFAGSPNLSERASQLTEQTIREITNLEEAVNINIQEIREKTPGLRSLAKLDFELISSPSGWLVHEKTSLCVIRVVYPPPVRR